MQPGKPKRSNACLGKIDLNSGDERRATNPLLKSIAQPFLWRFMRAPTLQAIRGTTAMFKAPSVPLTGSSIPLTEPSNPDDGPLCFILYLSVEVLGHQLSGFPTCPKKGGPAKRILQDLSGENLLPTTDDRVVHSWVPVLRAISQTEIYPVQNWSLEMP